MARGREQQLAEAFGAAALLRLARRAACCFGERRGGLAAIGALADASDILGADAGTRVVFEPA